MITENSYRCWVKEIKWYVVYSQNIEKKKEKKIYYIPENWML